MPTGYKEASFKTTLTNDDSLSANPLMNRQLSQPQLNNLKIPDISVIKGKTHDGSDFVKTLLAGCSGIDVQQAVPLIRHHFKDMGMPADEQAGRLFLDEFPNPLAIAPGITSDMGNEYIDPFTIKPEVFRKAPPDIRAIDVAKNCAKGAKLFEPFRHLQ